MALICWKWQDMSVASTISTTRVRSSLKERGETLSGCHELKETCHSTQITNPER